MLVILILNPVFAALPPDEEAVISDDNSTDKTNGDEGDYFHINSSSNSS